MKTSWKLFRDHFRRVTKVNSWTTPEEQIQYLMLFLEGAAAEVLKDFDEQKSTAVGHRRAAAVYYVYAVYQSTSRRRASVRGSCSAIISDVSLRSTHGRHLKNRYNILS